MKAKVEHVVFLTSKRLYLRPVEQDDLQRCLRWINDPDVRQYILSQFPREMPWEQRWFESLGKTSPPTDIHLAIVHNHGHRHIGMMGIHRIDWINRNCTTGAIIGEADCRDKGYGGEAKALVLDYAFNTLGMHRVASNVLATNPRSLAYLKRSGYREEGRRREHIFRKGKWIDDIAVAILDHEWRAAQKKRKKK